jgi:predicted transcriptional regulator YheO
MMNVAMHAQQARAQAKTETRKPRRGSTEDNARSRDVAAERKSTMGVLRALAGLLEGVVGPNTEVVVHDLTQPTRSVAAIVNGHVTGRALGSSILEGPRDDKAFAHAIAQLAPGKPSTSTIVSSYPTLTNAGQPLKSDTVIFRDGTGAAFAALCINSDMTVFKAAQSWLGKVLGDEKRPTSVQSAKRPEVDALTQEILEDAIRGLGKPIGMLSRAEKVRAAEHMLRRGVFMMRGGVERAATALGVSRFTIYNYLEEIRGRDASGSV